MEIPEHILERLGECNISPEVFKRKINKTIQERNHFWWGADVGVGYGTRLEEVRCGKDEQPSTNGFEALARVKYHSAYDGEDKGEFVKWY